MKGSRNKPFYFQRVTDKILASMRLKEYHVLQKAGMRSKPVIQIPRNCFPQGCFGTQYTHTEGELSKGLHLANGLIIFRQKTTLTSSGPQTDLGGEKPKQTVTVQLKQS